MPLDGYLLDTCLLSALLDPTKVNHAAVCSAVDNLEEAAPKYVSVITLAELRFGIRLATLRRIRTRKDLIKLFMLQRRIPLSM